MEYPYWNLRLLKRTNLNNDYSSIFDKYELDMNVLNLSLLNEWSHIAFQHFFKWISRPETLAQVLTFCSMFSLQHSLPGRRIIWNLWKANEYWSSSPQMKLKIFLCCKPKCIKSEKGPMYGLLKPTFAVTEMFFSCCQFYWI